MFRGCIYQAFSRIRINPKSETPTEVNVAFARSIVRALFEFQFFYIVSLVSDLRGNLSTM